MGRKTATNRRPQTQKDRAMARAIQELRRSSAAGPIPSKAKYNRAIARNASQRGIWMED